MSRPGANAGCLVTFAAARGKLGKLSPKGPFGENSYLRTDPGETTGEARERCRRYILTIWILNKRYDHLMGVWDILSLDGS